jgi:hypothetical protein
VKIHEEIKLGLQKKINENNEVLERMAKQKKKIIQ